MPAPERARRRAPSPRAGDADALAVGEGAQVIATIHAFLADAGERIAVTADHGRL
jgi:hypothetical protein